MKIKIIGVITAILIFCFAPFSIIANADYLGTIENYDVVDYSDYITNIKIEDNKDIITCEIPLEDCVLEWVREDQAGDLYSNGIIASNEYVVKFYNSPHHNYSFTFYLLGNNFIDSSYIPSGTEFSYTVNASFSEPNPTTNHYGHVIAYSIALDSEINPLLWNASDKVQIITDKDKTVTSIFNKNDNTRYLSPAVQIKYTPFMDNDDPYLHEGFFKISLNKCIMRFSLETALREQQQSQQTNQMLQYIVKSNPEIEQRVAELEQKLNEKTEEADRIQEELENMYKPDVESLVGEVDTFEIVDEADVGEYTDIFGAILDSDIVKNMMLCCVGVALLSLVLFGKKG